MSREEFEKLVQEGVSRIPKKFRDKLSNVAIVIEDEPSSHQLKKLNLSSRHLLFGLYQGIPQTKRRINYSGVLPDKITIFQKPIEKVARGKEEIRELVKNTIWHEIAHHFGSSEAKIRQIEFKRRKFK